MSNELTVSVERQGDLTLADTMLEETQAVTQRLLCKKGVWSLAGNDLPNGKEYIAAPGDALRGFCKWEEDHVVDQKVGRIADRFALKREELPADEDWKPQYAVPLEDPETGDVVLFVSCSVGGKIAVEKLIHATATAVKKGTGDLTPLVRLSVSSFPTEKFGIVTRPAFEIVPRETLKEALNDELPF